MRHVYRCTMCYTLSEDSKFKNNDIRCPFCDRGYMREIPLTVEKRPKPEEKKAPAEIVCCVSCGRDTKNQSGICSECKPKSRTFRTHSENQDRKFMPFNNGGGSGVLDENN